MARIESKPEESNDLFQYINTEVADALNRYPFAADMIGDFWNHLVAIVQEEVETQRVRSHECKSVTIDARTVAEIENTIENVMKEDLPLVNHHNRQVNCSFINN